MFSTKSFSLVNLTWRKRFWASTWRCFLCRRWSCWNFLFRLWVLIAIVAWSGRRLLAILRSAGVVSVLIVVPGVAIESFLALVSVVFVSLLLFRSWLRPERRWHVCLLIAGRLWFDCIERQEDVNGRNFTGDDDWIKAGENRIPILFDSEKRKED